MTWRSDGGESVGVVEEEKSTERSGDFSPRERFSSLANRIARIVTNFSLSSVFPVLTVLLSLGLLYPTFDRAHRLASSKETGRKVETNRFASPNLSPQLAMIDFSSHLHSPISSSIPRFLTVCTTLFSLPTP